MTEYVPAVDTVIEVEVAPLLHNSEPVKPEAVNTELPQLLATATVGAGGFVFGAAVPAPVVLVHPFIVCVTVYIPADIAVIEGEVSPVLHNNEPVKPEAVNTELSQLLDTDTAGAGGIDLGTAVPLPAALIQPFTVWVTV